MLGNPLDGEYNVSQNLPPVHYPCGAFWINRTEPFLRRTSLYGEPLGRCRPAPRGGRRHRRAGGPRARRETHTLAMNAWDGRTNVSAYDEVEAMANYATQSELEAYRRERLEQVRAIRSSVPCARHPDRGLRVVDVGPGSSAFLYALERAGLLRDGLGIERSATRHEFAERWRERRRFRHVTNLLANFADV